MPIYEFHCSDCRRDSEVLVRSTAWTGTPCPHCGSVKLTKKLSVFSSTMGSESECAPAACPANHGSCCAYNGAPCPH